MPVLTRPSATLPAEQLQGASTAGEAFGAALAETWATGPTGALITAADIDEAEHGSGEYAGEVFMATRVGGIVPQAPKLSPRLSPEVAKQRVAEAGLAGHVPLDKYPGGIREETLGLLIRLNQDKVRRQTLAAEYDGYAPGIAGMVIGSLIDPANVATAFVPVVGEARYAQLLARAGGMAGRTGVRVGVGAAEGSVGAALVEPAIYAGQQQWRTDYDAYDSMLNIAGGAAFGSLLHGGAGLVKDAFGRPMPTVDAVSTPPRQPFADPDVYVADAFKAKARAQGVSETAIAALAPQAPRDDVTGFFDGRQQGVKAGTVQRALDHARATGEPAYYVSADIYNLGGLNAAMGNVAEAANVHYRAMAGILREELARTGADVVPLRTGGDELGAVVVNADAQAVADAMAAVDARVAAYAQREGLAEIPHPKRSGEQGVGLHSGVAPIAPGLTIDDILRHADEGIDASKRGVDRVRRNETPAHGLGPDTGGGARRLSGEAPGGVRGEAAGTPEYDGRNADTAGARAEPKELNDAAAEWIAKGTDSKYFRRWFGESKAVDAEGKPLRLYHGTVAAFDAFEPARAGQVGDRFGDAVFFTSSPKVAEGYAQRLDTDPVYARLVADEDAALNAYGPAVAAQFRATGTTTGDIADGPAARSAEAAAARRERRRAIFSNEVVTPGANVVPAYLRIERPVVIDAQGRNYHEVHAEAFARAEKEGADGIIVRNVVDSANEYAREPSDVYAVFSQGQIKSATGNSGHFDTDSPSLTDPFAPVRPFIADLEPEVQAAALRSAVTQMAEGRPVDITPTLLAETDYPEAMRRALANSEAVAAADPVAAQLADARVQQGEPAEQLAAVREYLADTRERLGERGEGLEWESDLKTQRDAVKAATLCMMRNA